MKRYLHIGIFCALYACGSDGIEPAVGLGNVPAFGPSDIGVFRTIVEAGDVPDESVLSESGFFAEHSFPSTHAACAQSVCAESSLAIARRYDGNAWTMAGIVLRAAEIPAPRPTHHVLLMEGGLFARSEWPLLHARITESMRENDRISIYLLDQSLTPVLENQSREATPPEVSGQSVIPEFYANLRQLRSKLRQLRSGNEYNVHATIVTSGLRASPRTETAQLGDDDSIVEIARRIASEGSVITLIGTLRPSTEAGEDETFDASLPGLLARASSGPILFAEQHDRLLDLVANEVAAPPVQVARNITVRIVAGEHYRRGSYAGAQGRTELPGEVTLSLPTFWTRMGESSPVRTVPLFVELLSSNGLSSARENEIAFSVRFSFEDENGSHTQDTFIANPLRAGIAPTGGPRFVGTDAENSASENESAPLFVMWSAFESMRTGLAYYATGDCARAQDTLSRAHNSLRGWDSLLPIDNRRNDIELVSAVTRNVVRGCSAQTPAQSTALTPDVRLADLSR